MLTLLTLLTLLTPIAAPGTHSGKRLGDWLLRQINLWD